MSKFFSESDLYLCKYASAGEDKDGYTVPWCTLQDFPCNDVLRFADESCKYTRYVDDFERIEEEGAE